MMKHEAISHDDLPPVELGDELDGSMAIAADPEVLPDPNRGPWARADEPESNGQLLAVMTQTIIFFLLLFIHVQQLLRFVRNIAYGLQSAHHITDHLIDIC